MLEQPIKNGQEQIEHIRAGGLVGVQGWEKVVYVCGGGRPVLLQVPQDLRTIAKTTEIASHSIPVRRRAHSPGPDPEASLVAGAQNIELSNRLK